MTQFCSTLKSKTHEYLVCSRVLSYDMNNLTDPRQCIFASELRQGLDAGIFIPSNLQYGVYCMYMNGYTYLVGVVVRVANHMVHPVWLRKAYGTNGCLLLDSLTSAGNRNGHN